MNAEEAARRRYLTQACRGLWGRRRRELMVELEGHLRSRCHVLRLQGLDDAAATRQALRELGAPARVSAGMAQVYTLPAAARAAALSALLGAATLTVLTTMPGLAQVQGFRPSYTPLPGPYTYLDAQSLRAELAKAGVGVEGPDTRPTLRLPGTDQAVLVDTGSGDLDPFLQRTLLRDYASGQVYLDAGVLAGAAIRAGLPVRIEGWQNPKLHLGAAALQLGTPERPIDAYNLYSLALAPLARQLGLGAPQSARWADVYVYRTHQLVAQADAVYALVTLQRLPDWQQAAQPLVLSFDLAQADAAGRLRFSMAYDLEYLQLSADPADLRRDAEALNRPGAALTYASAGQPAHALLLRLSGRLDEAEPTYAVVPQRGLSVGD